MRRWRWLALVVVALAALAMAAACDSSDDEERLAAQRLFRNFLIQADPQAAADVRIQSYICTVNDAAPCDAAAALPLDFPLFEDLTLLGSAFSDTEDTRELIVGWESDADVEEVYDWYRERLDTEPWSVVREPRVAGVDFIEFRDEDFPEFRGELRIAKEGNEAVLVLIAREILSSDAAAGS